ncbi:tetratricopeptide repeat protein [Ruegeria atlantica]|uniref:PEP-CTERM system TPR-repeat lipoprotein n=1 Tax=Ruegeria atlantica TaxID=81569 RepID=A0A0P1E6M1_9RHOB|nr:tetratricopeptide repeat protein [Ruegeria atlantica]CUH44469.1 hypothetical protein RUM4293_03371 [Ruegeria atlantica]
MKQTQAVEGQRQITNADVRAALESILANEMFSQSERLSGFLKYIVDEALAGRGDAIRGKTIAQDVYERVPQDSGDPENIVRVHARQLRQNLGMYYETEGKRDPVHIHLDSGGYCPRFEYVDVPTRTPTPSRKRSALTMLLVFVIGGGLGALIANTTLKQPVEVQNPDAQAASQHEQLTRQALLEKSAAALQAANFAEQARGLIFPIFERSRQELLTGVFQHIISTDPEYFGGYAGAAQTLATKAILTPKGSEREEITALAGAMAQKALTLGPTEPWVQSALAWAEVAKGDYEAAYRLSSRAKDMTSQDGHVLDFHGAISLFSGRFEEAIEAADRTKLKGRSNQRFANRNIYGAANYHLGNNEKTLEGFEAAAAFGDPLSAPSLAYQAAALQRLGRVTEANSKLAELNRAWPNAPLGIMFAGIYQNHEHVEEILAPLRELGWTSNVANDEGNATARD